MINKKGKDYIQNLKDLFIEGCANDYYGSAQNIREEAKQIMRMENIVKEFVNYMDTEDKENYDFAKLAERLKTDGE